MTSAVENFSEFIYLPHIKNEGKIYSAMQDGPLPLISADDIAAVAFRTLTDPRPHNTDYILLGPTNWTYDEVLFSVISAKEVCY